MNEKKVQSRKRNQNQTQKKSRDRQAQPRNTFGNQHRSQFQAAFQIFCRRWLPVCIAALILSGTANLLRESRLQQEVAAKIVRFHVRANSDCASDQQIKLQVRDAVAEELQTILHGAETKAETEEILRENEPSIRAAALQTLRAGGSTDDITVTYGKASFEEKETGGYILPAGTYDASDQHRQSQRAQLVVHAVPVHLLFGCPAPRKRGRRKCRKSRKKPDSAAESVE